MFFIENIEKPIVLTSLNMFKITFPNLNYQPVKCFDGTLSGTLNGTQNGTLKIEALLSKLIKENNKITRKELARLLGVSIRTLQRIINNTPNIKYEGTGKSGHWTINE